MCRSKQTLGHDEAANWPRHASDTAERRTALFEGADGAEAMAVSNVLDRMDIDTMWCPGPGAPWPPLLAGRERPLRPAREGGFRDQQPGDVHSLPGRGG